jgi:hypothetical protein
MRAQKLDSMGSRQIWAFLLTFAGVRVCTNFREMSRQGLRARSSWVLSADPDRMPDPWLGGWRESDLGLMTAKLENRAL